MASETTRCGSAAARVDRKCRSGRHDLRRQSQVGELGTDLFDIDRIHHHDDVYARAHGYPSVFAPGMLTMALTGRAVTDVVGPAELRSFGGRLTGQVWPGATLRTAVVPEGPVESGLTRYAVTTTDQDGRTVFAGTAEATRDGER